MSAIAPFLERKCPQCGKTFCTGIVSDWAYKARNKTKSDYPYVFFCSWKCLCAWRKEHEESMYQNLCR